METDYEEISMYLEGNLSEEDKIAFEKRLETDSKFKEEFELYKEVNNSLEKKYTHLEKENALKQTLNLQGEKHFNKTEVNTPKKSNLKILLFRISSLAAVLVIGFFLLKPQTDLYTQFAEHQELSVQVKGENEDILIQAEGMFNDKKYSDVITLFKLYLNENPNDLEIQMALGISLLEDDEIEDAMIIFSNIYGQDNVFKNKAAWYMALSYLKLEDFSQTKAFIGEIENESFYYKKAQKLLKKLK